MAKTRAERKAAKAELAAASNRAAMFDAAPPKFDTPEEANAALASVAKVFRINEATKKETTMSEKKQSKRAAKAAVLGARALPPLPKAPAKPKPTKPCACGCGESTKGTWAPGHDSNYRGWLLRVERGVLKLSEVPDFMRAKIKAEVATRAQADAKTKASGE